MKWRSSLLLIRMEWSIRLSDELNRKHMEWAILCASGFSFWVDRTYVFPDIIFLRWIEFMCFRILSFGWTELMCFLILSFWGIELMCFQMFSFWVDRTYAFPDIFFLRWIELMCFQIFFRGQNLCVSRYFS